MLLLLFCSDLTAQQNNMWYFGRKAALNFNITTPGPIPSVLSNSVMNADEGSASICDQNGNLLFYTNSKTVFNRNHQVMLNGDGLMGHLSAVQSSIIVPQPGNNNIFFLFTADALENNYANGYRYSVIDMNGDGGLGEVISKNNLLLAPCTERMTAVRHADGISVWLITNDNASNTFRSWLITCTGIQPAPVISNTGDVLNIHVYQNTGMMKVSPDGKQLCQTHFPNDVTSTGPSFLQLFDFNNLTGVLSNPKKIIIPATSAIACEYSPDSKLLYLASPTNKTLDQLEAKLPTVTEILGSRIRINVSNNAYYTMQLAPDEKIYMVQLGANVSVINKPNVKGTGCNYVTGYLNLAPGSSYIGLPSFINDLSTSPDNGFSYQVLDVCTGLIQFTGLSTMAGPVSWEWDFGDGNTSTLPNPQHTYADPTQTYIVRVKITSSTSCGYTERTKLIFPGGLVISPAFDYVAKCDSGYVRFTNLSTVNPDPTAAQLLWDFGDGNTSTEPNPIHPYAAGGIYTVNLSIQTGTPCLDKSVTQVINLEIPDIHAFPNITVDAGQPVQLGVTGGGNIFVWTPANGLSDDSISNPIAVPPRSMFYKVTVTNDAGCKDSDSVYIKVNPLPGIYMPTAFTPNNDGKNDIIRPTVTKEFMLEEFSIYNRWGEKIFTTSQNGAGWNGKRNGLVQDTGVYIWIVNATDNRDGAKHRLKGTFVIIR